MRFRFACQRSGRCCTHGEGYVWVTRAEIAALAAERALEVGVFEERFVREVVDPRSREPRLSLREERGRCVLLEGQGDCSVYASRPEQCRTFPHWPSVLADRASFEATRALCPGIAVEVDGALRERADARLAEWYEQRVPIAETAACPFPDRGANAHATGLEVDHALARGVLSDRPGLPAHAEDSRVGGPCPWWSGGSCRAGEARPLGCRPAFREQAEMGEALWRELRALENELDYPAAVGRLRDLCASRLSGELFAIETEDQGTPEP